ncbi:DJ-1/PfpI family protein [Candidatus Woesearchaeota archaeon]|nr:DJ-1/PfpI family protein [Candidatus Woesearchaeota archaeon]
MAYKKTPRIIYLIAQQDFRDEEFFIPKRIFEENGIEVVVASIKKGVASGSLGGKADVDIAVKDADCKDYDALVIAGGKGALELKEHKEVIRLIREIAADTGKITAAICIAPAILAIAGVLQGKKATIWNIDGLKERILEENSATYIAMPVVVDDNIITGNGPGAAEEFGRQIVKKLDQFLG